MKKPIFRHKFSLIILCKIVLFNLPILSQAHYANLEKDLHHSIFLSNKSSETLRDTVEIEWIKSIESNYISSIFRNVVMSLDKHGNIFFAAINSNNGSDDDIMIVKYSSSGDELWRTYYDGPSHKNDSPIGIEIDPWGNCYIGGNIPGEGNNSYFAVIKYNSAGVLQWEKLYQDQNTSENRPWAIAIDSIGNCYITGFSTRISNAQNHFLTIKYDSSGNLNWVSRFYGPQNHSSAIDIAVYNGNVYVTGNTATILPNLAYDYATVKYDRNGNEKWNVRYSGPGADDRDFVWALVVDDSGNAYVTGCSKSGSAMDYATVKYDSMGNELWSNRYGLPDKDDCAVTLAVNNKGDVYVAGISESESSDAYDLTMVKYDQFGVEQWVKKYDGPTVDNDIVQSIFLDGQGDIYVTGYNEELPSTLSNYLTIKFDENGNILWASQIGTHQHQKQYSESVCVDTAGNVYIAGYGINISPSIPDFYDIIKYKQTSSTIIVPFNEMLPVEFSLSQNYPNPFNPATTIQFGLPEKSQVQLTVYNITGELVTTLANGEYPAGSHRVVFDASQLASGIYLYRLSAYGVSQAGIKAGEFIQTRKMMVLK